MPGGGLLSLIAYGSANTILSGNPDFTYFYTVFKKYTHFALETTSKLMDGPTDYPYEQSTQLKCRIDRVGDLLTDIYFSFRVPAIFSKYHDIDVESGPLAQDEFKWVRYLGAAAIQSVYITVGPNKVQEFTGEYLMAKALIDYPKDKFEKWQRLVGDVPELNDPAKGLFGNKTFTGDEYPTVYSDSRNPAQGNTPSIPEYNVMVPLPFWFTEDGQALPLIGLQNYTVDITINMNPSQNLYTVRDLSGYEMSPRFRVLSSTDSIRRNIPDFSSSSDPTRQIRNFFTDFGFNVPPLNTWPMLPTIHTTYAFLPQEERNIYATTPLQYIVRQVTMVPFPEIITNGLLDLEIHNPITRVVLVPRRSDSVLYRNQMWNVTNWWYYPERPKIPTQVGDDSSFIENFNATGLLVPSGQLDIIQSLRILTDGNQIQEPKSNFFFTNLVPYKYLDGQAGAKIPVYSFELHSPTAQPSGSINSSRIRKFQLDLQVYPLPVNSSYIYSMNVYVENLNFFLVQSGMGDVKYAL
jgi:hypothetical protein